MSHPDAPDHSPEECQEIDALAAHKKTLHDIAATLLNEPDTTLRMKIREIILADPYV